MDSSKRTAVLLRQLRAAAIAAAAMAAMPVQPWAGPGPQDPDARPRFSARTELVVLHLTVRDEGNRYVGGLDAGAFTVREDGRPQPIEFFVAQDAPVTVGLVIDNSGSMIAATEHLLAAASAFVETSHPQDEIFALVFNEVVRTALPARAPFTSDAAQLHAALSSVVKPEGRTSLHDAILAALRYAERGTYARKVLVVVADGSDNASEASFDDVLRRVEASNTAIYTIATLAPNQRDGNPRRLRELAELTGGETFRPRRVPDVVEVLERIARDIRHTYTIGYVPPADGRDGLRRIDVDARGAGRQRLSVRTRRSYRVETPER